MARQKKSDNLLITNSYADFSQLFSNIRKNVNTFRQNMGKFEEPYSEVSQNHRHIKIKINLPDVHKKDLRLHMGSKHIEVKATQKKRKGMPSKTFYRSIPLPSTAVIQEAMAHYQRTTLKITIPNVLY